MLSTIFGRERDSCDAAESSSAVDALHKTNNYYMLAIEWLPDIA